MYVGARMAALEEKRLMTERGGKDKISADIFISFDQKFDFKLIRPGLLRGPITEDNRQ